MKYIEILQAPPYPQNNKTKKPKNHTTLGLNEYVRFGGNYGIISMCARIIWRLFSFQINESNNHDPKR